MITIINAYTLSECMDAVAEWVERAERAGERNLVFCEDRLTLVAERAILRRTGGTFLSGVTTFSRFLKTDETVLSRQGSVMAVADVMTSLQRDGVLKCFLTAESVAYSAETIYEQLAQFGASEITPEELQESVAGLDDVALKNKMHDLALIYQRYGDFLKQKGYLDESKYLSLVPKCLEETEGLGETNVYFLCYASFTAQAMKTLAVAFAHAKNTVGVFCDGKEELYAGQALRRFKEAAKAYGEIRLINKGEPLIGEAELLRKGLYNPATLKDDFSRTQTERIRIFAASDKNAETEYVALQIKKELFENPSRRYRDFAVLVSDLPTYSLAIKKTFQEYGIPFFADEKRSLKNHPVSRFLLDALEVVKDGFSPSAVDALLSSAIFFDGDEYRNYLLKYANYRGGALRPIKEAQLMESLPFSTEEKDALLRLLQGCRERLLKATAPFKRKATGREYVNGVRWVLDELQTKTALDALIDAVDDEAQKEYLLQFEKKIDVVLADAELLIADRELTIAEFSAIFEDGLEATEISLIPLKLDAVVVGDVVDSRIERVGVLFAVGMTDAVPRTSDDANLVTDKDKQKLLSVKTVLEPMVEEVNLRNREEVCLNLCTFTDKLFLTYPLGTNGEDPALSEVFAYVKNLFNGADGNRLREEKTLSDEEFVFLCSSLAPAVRRLPIERQAYVKRQDGGDKRFSSLYRALQTESDVDGLVEERDLFPTIARAEETFFPKGTPSPTLLESYMECPYRALMTKGVGLKEREESVVLAVDTGNFIHALLQKTTGKIKEYDTEERFASYAREVGESLLTAPAFTAMKETNAGAYSAERLLAEGVTVARAVYRQIQNSDFQNTVMEKEIVTETFRGKADRIDTSDDFVRVIDYKTGKIDASATSYYMGQKIQLQLYMSALMGEKEPAGVFYFPAAVSFSDEEDGKFRMQGFLNGDERALRQGDKFLSDDKKSDYFDARLTKNAQLKKVMNGEDFRSFIEYSRLVAGQAETEMRAGFVAPSPTKGACRYCQYGGLCRFSADCMGERTESDISPKTIAEIVRKSKGEN